MTRHANIKRENIDILKGSIIEAIYLGQDGEPHTLITEGCKLDYENILRTHYTDEIRFLMKNGEVFIMYHEQDCCEEVELIEIHGDLEHMLNSQVLDITEDSNRERDEYDYGTITWTFYKMNTTKGFISLRWRGDSNGYYSEEVDFGKIEKANHTN